MNDLFKVSANILDEGVAYSIEPSKLDRKTADELSSKAHAATTAAHKSNSVKDHDTAMQAHGDAERYHRRMYHSARRKKDEAGKEHHAQAFYDHRRAAYHHHDSTVAMLHGLPAPKAPAWAKK